MLNFTKVAPGQSLQFAKADGKIYFGVNWSKVRGRAVDLDAGIAICKVVETSGFLGFGAKKTLKPVEFCNFTSPRRNGVLCTNRLTHSGDDRTGDSERDYHDNEVMSLDPSTLGEDEVALVGLWSFNGVKLQDLTHAGVRVYRGSANNPSEALAEVDLTSLRGFGLTVGAITNKGGIQQFTAMGTTSNATRPSEWLDEAIKAYV